MIFPRCEVNTDVTCLQVIAKKEVIAKNMGPGGWGGEGERAPLNPPLTLMLLGRTKKTFLSCVLTMSK